MFIYFSLVIRFVEGGECYGRLEMLHGINIISRGPYGQACTRDTSDADIQVVCRQLGCDPEGAHRVSPDPYVNCNIYMHQNNTKELLADIIIATYYAGSDFPVLLTHTVHLRLSVMETRQTLKHVPG